MKSFKIAAAVFLTATALSTAAFAVSPGEEQMALSLGVEPGQYTMSELIRLEGAIRDNDQALIAFIKSGESRKTQSDNRTSPGHIQNALSLGVDPADYSPAELAKLSAQMNDDNDTMMMGGDMAMGGNMGGDMSGGMMGGDMGGNMNGGMSGGMNGGMM